MGGEAMGYDLLASGERGMSITTYPFYWLARLAARPIWWGPGKWRFSITRERSDIIWRSD
jgi:hypothetical protein